MSPVESQAANPVCPCQQCVYSFPVNGPFSFSFLLFIMAGVGVVKPKLTPPWGCDVSPHQGRLMVKTLQQLTHVP